MMSLKIVSQCHRMGSYLLVLLRVQVYSTGRGVRLKGTTLAETSKFEARTAAAIGTHLRTKLNSATTSAVGEHLTYSGADGISDLSSGDVRGSPASGRRTKGMSPREVSTALDKVPQPSPLQIKQKIKAGVWSGPTFDDSAPPTLSVNQETALRVSQAVGGPASVTTLKQAAGASLNCLTKFSAVGLLYLRSFYWFSFISVYGTSLS